MSFNQNLKNYWKDFKIKQYYCPNQSIHRLLKEVDFNYKNKKILEVGYFSGEDLKEFKRRGSNIYGTDINKYAFNNFSKLQKKNLVNLDAGKEKIPFKIKFDLVYGIDFLYYLNKKEIQFHFLNSSTYIKKNGLFVAHFIEHEFKLKKDKKKITEKYLNISNNYFKKKISEKDNPINFLKKKDILKYAKRAGFIQIGEKFYLETFGVNEKKIKCYKFILFKKC